MVKYNVNITSINNNNALADMAESVGHTTRIRRYFKLHRYNRERHHLGTLHESHIFETQFCTCMWTAQRAFRVNGKLSHDTNRPRLNADL